MPFDLIKSLLPSHPTPTRVWRGPFRGAQLVINPRDSLRKILGVYEHELNLWIETVLHRVDHVIDVGANDGYFTFGCAAAFKRLGKAGEIVAFEPQSQHYIQLQRSVEAQSSPVTKFTLVKSLVGQDTKPGVTNLDRIQWSGADPNARGNTLIKIDVEGAELEVLMGAGSWLNSSNYFLIEVHQLQFLEEITRLFAANTLTLDRVDQRPLPVIGGEHRQAENWWLVSRLNPEPV